MILNQCPSHGITLFFSVQNTVQSEWWPVQQFFRLLTYCCSYLSKILIMKLCHHFLGFISVHVQYNFIFHSKYLYSTCFFWIWFLKCLSDWTRSVDDMTYLFVLYDMSKILYRKTAGRQFSLCFSMVAYMHAFTTHWTILSQVSNLVYE